MKRNEEHRQDKEKTFQTGRHCLSINLIYVVFTDIFHMLISLKTRNFYHNALINWQTVVGLEIQKYQTPVLP